MPRSSHATLQAEGLPQLLRDFRKLDRDLAREAGRSFGEAVGRPVIEQAQRNVRSAHHVKSGRMVRSFRISVRRGEALIRNTAKRGGFPYPYRVEHARAFLEPALTEARPRVERAFEQWLDGPLRQFESGG